MSFKNFRLGRVLVLVALYGLGLLGIVASGGGSGGGGNSGGNGGGGTNVVASFTVSPNSGDAPLFVTFDGSASTTSAGTITSYEWRINGITPGEMTTTPVYSRIFSGSGLYTVQLVVHTSGNAMAVTSHTVTVGEPASTIWLGGYQSSLITDSAVRVEFMRIPGGSYTGTYEDSNGHTGSLEFVFDDDTSSFDVTITETTPGCSGLFTGLGSGDLFDPFDLPFIVFDFTGTNCDGAHAEGFGILVLQYGEVLSWGHEGLGALRLDGGELFFTDKSEYPLKKIDTATGTVMPLAHAMRAVSGLTLLGNTLLWTDYTDDIGDTGCAGAGAKSALVRAAANGSNPRRIAEGDVCGAPMRGAALTDGTYAYWGRVDGAGPFIERVPLAGGDPQRLATVAFGADVTFAIDATHLYWTESFPGESAAIKRCPLAGCGAASPTIVSSETTYALEGSIIVDTAYVYVGLRREGSFAPAIARVPKAGGAAADIIQNASARGLASDGTNLYWWDTDVSSVTQIETAPVTGGSPTPLAIDIPRMAGLALGPGYVYWIEGTSGTDQNDGKVRRVLTTGGVAQTLKADAAWPAFIRFDSGTGAVIYAEGGTDENREQAIRRMTIGGVVTTLVKGIPPSQPLAVDATSVYVPAGFSIAKLSRSGLGIASRLAPAAFYVAAIEADANGVYWLTGDPNGNIVSSPPSGTSTPALLGAANGFATQLRQNGTELFVNRMPNLLYRLPKTGGGLIPLSDDLAFPIDFVVDDDYAYVVEADARAITRIDLATTNAASAGANLPLYSGWFTLAHDADALYLMGPEGLRRYAKPTGMQSEPYGLVLQEEFELPAQVAVDDTYVYWVETTLGAVKRLPK